MSAPVQREVMCIIDHFFRHAPPGNSPWKKRFFCLSFVFSIEEIAKIKICHMVTKEHTEAIEGRRQLIAVDVLDSEEADKDASIDHDDAALDEEDGSGLLWAGVTEDVGGIHNYLKSSSFLSYMLKPSKLITQGFGKNSTAQEKIFKHMCDFGSHAEWRKGRIVLILMLIPPKINCVY